MKKCIATLVIVVLCISLSSCKPTQDFSNCEDSYLDGLNRGYEDAFLNLWYAAAPGVNVIHPSKPWETEHFSITIISGENEWGRNINIELLTHNLSISDCFEEQKMLFNVFSYDGNQFEGLLTDDLFYMYATLEEVTENAAKATVGIRDTTELIAILVAVDGCIYKATFPIIK